MDKKIIKNFIYNIGYQILTMLLPIITVPYVSRVLDADSIGIYSYTFSITQIFLIIGMFAVGSYGVKEIASNRDDLKYISKKFYEIRLMQKSTMIVAIIIYILIFIILGNSKYKTMYIIQSINLFAGLIDISWLYIGIEDFKKIVTRNILVKMVSLVFIFIFVKNNNDIYAYTLILALSVFLGNLSMWVYKKNTVKNIKIKNYNLIKNLILASTLLVPQLCYEIYTSFDRSILAWVSNMDSVGLFDQSQKIIRITVGIVTSLSIVMLPRIANMINNNSKEEINKLLKKSIDLTLFISMGCSFGIFAISDNFVPWFYGENYLNVAILLKISSIVCILTSLGSFFSNQYAIPSGNKKAYMIPIIIAAIISIILNIILGYKLGAVGACIAIVLTEMFALILRMLYLKSDFKYRYLFNNLIYFFISATIMVFSINCIRYLLNLKANIISTLIEVFIGAITYIITLIILKREYLILFKDIIFRIKNKNKRFN
ncbi:oligosaccharide flippase family protein [Clostridium perfringens]|uniref:oligosaccharide flippase family protein n=1 Tax=Clostridium perfringens TaxID=1502 RepID=UPI001ABA475D|nr:oligosaccharide flippase family protein [Clostridium perfringens]EIF6157399.1 oligosaccharide flippase family protein [Clostridium perfringens]MBO3376792.1 oligosaccharide flippase family protein [Clostridium perfringens]MDK0790941.1 oligosaccharide flippase family protein [Clostridium perfringens]MDK0886958.1 oligosaccharide flippase family protein [Clostridium perfringens]MDM0777379.1 oligosaccharide flippase family protein [Clostridium perfringens]